MTGMQNAFGGGAGEWGMGERSHPGGICNHPTYLSNKMTHPETADHIGLTESARTRSDPRADAEFEKKRNRHKSFIRSQGPTLAAMAWEGFCEKGRGTVMVTPPEQGEGADVCYLSLNEIEESAEEAPGPQMRSYDPETQMVVTIAEDYQTSCYVVGVPSAPSLQADQTTASRKPEHADQESIAQDDEVKNVVVQIERRMVELGDIAHAIETLQRARFLYPREIASSRLLAMRGSLSFCFKSYDEDSRELYEIPEVRRFCQKLHRVWPHSLYFLDSQTASLQVMVLCHVKVDRQGPSKNGLTPLRVTKEEVIQFMEQSLNPYLELSANAGLSAKDAAEYLSVIAALFGIG